MSLSRNALRLKSLLAPSSANTWVEPVLTEKQSIAYNSIATEILFGGSAGSGKSHELRTSALRWCFNVPSIQAYLFRRTRTDLIKNHLFGPTGLMALLQPQLSSRYVGWNGQDAVFSFANGAKLWLCHAQHEHSVLNYYGSEIHVLLMDELTTFTDYQYRFLRSRVRIPSGLKIPERYRGLLPRIECGSNPGNIGHAAQKARFISFAPALEITLAPEDDGGFMRQFIPALLDDNPYLDKEYEMRLSGLGNESLVRALRYGDWDIQSGTAFTLSKKLHALAPFEIPSHWLRFASMDYGYAKPFSIGWWAVSDGTIEGIPFGALIRYKEWYGWDRRPDEGLRLSNQELSKGILERNAGDKLAYIVCDPSMWKEEGGPSIAEQLASVCEPAIWGSRVSRKGGEVVSNSQGRLTGFERADNTRLSGYQAFRARLEGLEGVPLFFAFDTCVHGFWRTVPDIQLDPDYPEEILEGQEDHCVDEVRYAMLSRPYVKQVPARRDALREYLKKPTFDDLMRDLDGVRSD